MSKRKSSRPERGTKQNIQRFSPIVGKERLALEKAQRCRQKGRGYIGVVNPWLQVDERDDLSPPEEVISYLKLC